MRLPFLCLLACLALLSGCYTFSALPVDQVEGQGGLAGCTVRVTYRDQSRVTFVVDSFSAPSTLRGHRGSRKRERTVVVDLSEVALLEVEGFNVLGSIGVVAGVTAVMVGAVLVVGYVLVSVGVLPLL